MIRDHFSSAATTATQNDMTIANFIRAVANGFMNPNAKTPLSPESRILSESALTTFAVPPMNEATLTERQRRQMIASALPGLLRKLVFYKNNVVPVLPQAKRAEVLPILNDKELSESFASYLAEAAQLTLQPTEDANGQKGFLAPEAIIAAANATLKASVEAHNRLTGASASPTALHK